MSGDAIHPPIKAKQLLPRELESGQRCCAPSSSQAGSRQNRHPSRLSQGGASKTYVVRGVSKIKTLSAQPSWNHVRTGLNAEAQARGVHAP